MGPILGPSRIILIKCLRNKGLRLLVAEGEGFEPRFAQRIFALKTRQNLGRGSTNWIP